jgi:16S rRNA pseudouridine516 synthase
MSKTMKLDRMLQTQGFGTRKWCQQLIRSGEVTIDGTVVEDPSMNVEVEGLSFAVYEERWVYSKHVYIALNKPPGYECSRKASHHPGVHTLLPEQFLLRDVQPVGRLDHDTTGLLLLSDDGAFIHRLSSPKHEVAKCYVATTNDPVTEELVGRLLCGVLLNDEPVPLAANSCRAIGSHSLEIVLQQGKYHQVKRMLAAAGNHCVALQRTRIGRMTLDALALAEGAWCYLDVVQLESLSSA